MNLDDLLDGAELPERSHTVCLAGKLLARHHALEAELEALVNKPGPDTSSLAGDPDTARAQEIRAQMADLVEQMRPFELTLQLRAMDPRSLAQLKRKHPQRIGEDGLPVPADRNLAGVNGETFTEPFIRACIVEPNFTDAQWNKLVVKLSQGQYMGLMRVASELTAIEDGIPLS